MNKSNFRVLLVHPGKQHSFETATSLKKAGILYKYVTTVYDRPQSITYRLKSILKGKSFKKASTRRCKALDDSDVIQFYELWGLLVLLISKLPFCSKIYFKLNLSLSNHFARKAAKLAIKDNVDAIIVYDGISSKGLRYIKEKAPHIKTIMDVSIAMRPFMKSNFEKDMREYHHSEFFKEESYLWELKHEKVILEELKFVDYFFVPSNIVKDSLEYCGIKPDKISIVPYGVNIEKFDFSLKKQNIKGPLKLVYVGQISHRKGLHHLLKIVKSYNDNIVQIALAGAYDSNNNIVKEYKDVDNIEFLGFVTRDVLAEIYKEADLFVFPTLGEGYGMVVLEALSTGTPVLISDLAGGNDAIENYINGIEYNGLSESALKNGLDWFINHKNLIPKMSKRARQTACLYTWNKYHQLYANRLLEFLMK